MIDSYTLLKKLNIDDLDEEVVEPTSSIPSSSDIIYQEDISPETAKRILGEEIFIDKPNIQWQMITSNEETVITAWLPDEEEPITFTLDSSDLVVTYEEMNALLSNDKGYSMDMPVVGSPTKSSNWLVIVIGCLAGFFCAGCAIMAYLFSLV